MSELRETDDEGIPTTRVPDKLSPNLMNFSTADKFAWLPLGLMGVLTALSYGGKFLGLVTTVLMFVLMYRIPFGRVITIVAEHVAVEPWIRLVQHEVQWQADRFRRFAFRRSNVLGLHVTNIGGWLGVVHIEGTKTDAIIDIGSGSDIATKDIRRMHARNMELADAIKKVASQNGFRIGTSFLHRRRPADPYAEMEMYQDNCMPAIYAAGTALANEGETVDRPLTPDENKAMLMEQLIGAACEGDSDVTQASIWTIEREPAVLQAAKGKRRRKTAALNPARLVAMQVAATARDNLTSAGVTDVAILDYSGVEDHLRAGWDVYDLPEYYAEKYLAEDEDEVDDRVDESSDALASTEPQPVDTESDESAVSVTERHWPNKIIKRGYRHCQLDNTFHSVLMIVQQPSEVIANTYFALHTIPVPYLSIATPGQAFKITREKFWLSRAIPISEGIVEGTGYRLNPTQQGRAEERERREREIHGSRLSLSFSILVGVAASSLEELEDRVAETERQLRLRGFEPKRITGRTLQIPAALSATTGIPML